MPAQHSTENNDLTLYIQKHLAWNFTVNVLDGTFFFLGFSFVSLVTVLPLFVSQLTDSPILIGLIPALFNLGFLLPQLLTARHVQRLARKKPFVMLMSANERFPFLILGGLLLLGLPNLGQRVTLITFFVILLWWTLGGGLTTTGWADMLAKLMPPRRRGLFFGTQTSLGLLLGAGGAFIAGIILDTFPYPVNFAYCFIIAGILMLISWGFLGLSREPSVEPTAQPETSADFRLVLKQVLWQDRNYVIFLLARSLLVLGSMPMGFWTVYAVSHFGITAETAGQFTSALLFSQTVFSILYGMLGDQRGHKIGLELAALPGVLAPAIALFTHQPLWMFPIFILVGASASGIAINGLNIVFEFAPPERRATYIGLTNTLLAPVGFITPLLGGVIVQVAGYKGLFVTAALCGLAGWALFHWKVMDPRHTAQTSPVLP
ncbi:MAG: MFS transporter [Chloroflexi bacterium]|nr:MFS transporter [Chloroflexota bacterium]